jgi:hypothetical protein
MEVSLSLLMGTQGGAAAGTKWDGMIDSKGDECWGDEMGDGELVSQA